MQNSLTRAALPQLSGNVLKVLAAITMTVDHVGLTLFPQIQALRLIGRLAFPIFAFMVAEGCEHTRNMGRYILHMLVLAVVCQVAYTVATGSWFLCVPVSFVLSISLIFLLQKSKEKPLWGIVFMAGVGAVWMLTQCVTLDYGFWGCMMPVAASLFRGAKRKMDENIVHVLAMGVFMIPLALQLGAWQWWSLLALPLLKMYSGQRGKYKMKYFFYIFYPAHLLIIEGIAILMTM